MANWLGNSVDWFGTALNLPDVGLSEWLAGGNKTDNTGRIPITPIFGQTTGSSTKAQTKPGVSAIGKRPTSATPVNNRPVGHTGYTQPAAQNTGGNYWAGGGAVGGASYAPAAPAAPAYDPNTIAQFDTGISTLNNALGRLGKQANIAKANVADQFRQNQNELESARNRAQTGYNDSTTDNQQGFRGNKNVINDQASAGLRGLMRMLGAYGAAGGSGMDLANEAVADTASQQRAGAGQAFAGNQRSLDTNWGQFQEEDKNAREKLADWKTQQERQVEAQMNTNRQDLLTRLAELQGQRAQAMGGSFKGGADPYIRQANELSSKIDQLGRFKPTFDGKTPVFQRPTLDSYNVGQGPDLSSGALPGGVRNPYLALLNPEEDERKTIL